MLNQREGERYMEGKVVNRRREREEIEFYGSRPSCMCENRNVIVVVANISSLNHDFLCVLLHGRQTRKRRWRNGATMIWT